MPLKEAIPLRQKKSGRGIVVCVVIIALLVAAIGALSVYTALTLTEQQRQMDTQYQQLLDMAAAAEAAENGMASQQQQLEQQQSQLTEKDEEISRLEETVSSLMTQIALKTTRSPLQIYQNLPMRIHRDYTGKKIVALTFDDGPGPYTARLLDELGKRGVRATFFVVGYQVDSYPELIQRMEAEGHVVGNHSNGHKNLTRLSAAGIKNEMDACATKIESLLGHKPEVMRCPGGNYNSRVLTYAKNAGIPIAHWSVDTRDWESRNVDAILSTVFGGGSVSDGSVILMHDIYETSVDAAIQMVDRLQQEGYTFVTIPELIYTENKAIEAGELYR